jgi:hypothetical protein
VDWERGIKVFSYTRAELGRNCGVEELLLLFHLQSRRWSWLQWEVLTRAAGRGRGLAWVVRI